ncbi:MAG TPA: ABC transporter substrate-binding protein [Thermoanaerobaculia bacterium]|nr:ABC transporter substrate-binding protein [Thermoanaerobaculia bacterium]
MRRFLASLVLAILAACTRETPAPPPPAPAPPVQRDGGQVVIRLSGDVQTLNYILHATENERQVLDLLYDPMIALDANMAPIPATIARWEILNGGKTFMLHVDPRATFSDGTPVRARDVVFTVESIVRQESMQFAGAFETLDLEMTKIVDDHTARVVFTEARAGQLLSFNIGVLPQHIYGRGDFKKNTQVIGNGPYVLKARGRDRSLLLTRREDYWREKPRLESIRFRVISDDAVVWKALQRGDIDVGRIDNDVWVRVKDDPSAASLVFNEIYRLAYNCIAWNTSDPLLDDVRVRRALAMLFDRQTVIDRLYAGQARPVSGPFTPDQWAHNAEIQPIAFNPPAASALLSSAGWTDSDGDGVLDREGKKFTLALLIIAGSKVSRDLGQVYQESLRQAGVQLELRVIDEAAFYESVLQRNFQAAFLSWVNEPDPDPYGLFHSSQFAPTGMNVVGYRSEEADQLMTEARSEVDRARRADLYHQLHDVLSRDQPYLWTVQVAEKWAVNRRVENVQVAKGLGLFGWYPGVRAWGAKEKR